MMTCRDQKRIAVRRATNDAGVGEREACHLVQMDILFCGLCGKPYVKSQPVCECRGPTKVFRCMRQPDPESVKPKAQPSQPAPSLLWRIINGIASGIGSLVCGLFWTLVAIGIGSHQTKADRDKAQRDGGYFFVTGKWKM